MYYLALAVLTFLLLDTLRSIIAIRRTTREFVKHSKLKPTPPATFGVGTPFHVVIMGDSTFDVRGDSKVVYGPAQVFVDHFARQHEVHVHMLAKAGAVSRDVVDSQLPQLKKLPQVDFLIVYMGANDAFTFKSLFAVGKSYGALLDFTETRKIPVLASELASYWLLGIFPILGRVWLYLANHLQNVGIRRASRGRKHVALIKTKQHHAQLHKKRSTEPYLADGIHATDEAAIGWGNYLLGCAQQDAAIAKIFKP